MITVTVRNVVRVGVRLRQRANLNHNLNESDGGKEFDQITDKPLQFGKQESNITFHHDDGRGFIKLTFQKNKWKVGG